MVDGVDTLQGQDTLTAQVVIDVAPLSDEDFLKLSPEQYDAHVAGQTVQGDTLQGDQNADTLPADDGKTNLGTDTQAGGEGSDSLPGSGNDTLAGGSNADPKAGIQPQGGQAPAKAPSDQAKPNAPADGKSKEQDPAAKPVVTAEKGKLPAGVTQESLVDFYSKITGPIKADGKDIQVRSPEDAIRLIQMGFNYSRRMQELKPVRALGQMLQDNKLDNPEQLNFLIDLSKGKKEAIQKLLADHKIDPIDLDTSKPEAYTPAQYQMDPKDQAFKEAVEATVELPGGRDLVISINKNWDPESKSALREQPAIFENLLAQKQSGVYERIEKELEYQRSLGYLVNVPFLQAYHQVGTAMQNAGVFNSPAPQAQSLAPVNPAPIDTGTRKAVAPKNAAPAPNLSSIQQPRAVSNQGTSTTKVDYSGLSDAEFMKLPPPR